MARLLGQLSSLPDSIVECVDIEILRRECTKIADIVMMMDGDITT